MRLVGQSAECLFWNTVFSFYCAIGKAIWKIACSMAPTGGEKILQANLAQTKIITFENKRPNVLAKFALLVHRSAHLGLLITVGKFYMLDFFVELSDFISFFQYSI